MRVAMAVSPSSSSLEAAAIKQQQHEMNPGVEPGTSQSQPQVQTIQPPLHTSNSNDNSNINSNSNNFIAVAATPPPPGLQAYTTSQIPSPQVAPVSFYRPMVQTPPPPLHPPGVVTSGQAPHQQQAGIPISNVGFGQQPPSGNSNVGFGQQAPGPNSNMSPNLSLGFGQQPASTITPPPVRPPGLFPVSASQYQQPRPFGHPPNGYSSAPMTLTGPPGAPPLQQPQMMNPAGIISLRVM